MNNLATNNPSNSAKVSGNIQNGLSKSKPLGLINALRKSKSSYSIEDLILIANNFHKNENLSKAEDIYRLILQKIPKHPIALHFLGVIALESEKSEIAIRLINESIKHSPNYFQAYNNLGNAFDSKGALNDAENAYANALEIKPNYTDAMFNLGLIKRKLRKFKEAESLFEKCVDIEPRRADVHFELGLVSERLGERVKAQMCYQVALNIDPNHSDARINLGNVLQTVGRLDESVEHYDIALEQDKNYTKALNAKGVALRKSGMFSASMDSIIKSDSVDPGNVETLMALGSAYQTMGDNDKAAEYYWQAINVEPKLEAAHKCLLFVALNNPKLTSQELFDIHITARGQFNKPKHTKKRFSKRNKNASRRIRIGYISSDFRTHVVAMNVLPVLANHDHKRFEVFLYGQVEYPDNITQVFKDNAEHWRSTIAKTDEEVVDMIQKDQIDILVYLAGRFDENRTLIATYKPAPIQVSFHDCATSGLEAMDYYLTDTILSPPSTPELFTETLYRLPYYYQYPVQEGIPDIKPAPVLSKGFITFGCFNKPEKINDMVIELWSRVLQNVPKSKLVLKYFNHYTEPKTQEHWMSRFKNQGIPKNRLIFKCKMDNRQSHLALYDNIDLALDPFPFNGATTTYEALSMGVPVITLKGKHFVDRVAASIVSHVGYPEFCAETMDEYVELAKKLANDPLVLNETRMKMRDTLHKSKICDGVTYAKNVETAYRDMWKTWCKTGTCKGK